MIVPDDVWREVREMEGARGRVNGIPPTGHPRLGRDGL